MLISFPGQRKLVFAMEQKTLYIIIGIIVVVVIIGAIAAMYSAPAPTTPQKTTATAPAAKAQKKYIVIGATAPLSGPFSIGGKRYKETYELWVNYINSQGGIYVKEYGRKLKLKLIVYDDKSDPTTAASLYEKLITVDKVDVLLGPGMSGLVHAAAPIAEKYKRPFTVIAGDDSIYKSGFHYIFNVYPVASLSTYRFFEFMSTLPPEQRCKLVGIIAESSAYGQAIAKGALENAKKFGIKAEIIENYPPNTKDFTPILQKAKSAGADCLINAGHMIGDIMVPKTAKEMGWTPKMIWVSVSITLPEFLNLNKTVEGVMGLGTWSPSFKTYQNDIFVKLFREKYGHDPYGHNVWAMASIQVMLRAIQLAGSLDPQKIRHALLTNDFPTVMGVFHFQENGLPPADEQAAYLFQVQNGVPVCVWPKKMATAKPIWPLPSG